MSMIDRQRVAAVRLLDELGYVFDGEWRAPEGTATATAIGPLPRLVEEADAMHALLVLHAEAIEGFSAGSPEEHEYGLIAETLEGYEAKRWPGGRAPRGHA